MSRRLITRTLTLASLAALAACSSDSTGPSAATVSDAQASADIAATSGSAISQDIGLMGGDMAQAGAAASNCTWNASAKNWSCAHSTETGWDVSRMLTIYSGGQPVQSYDAATTDSIHVELSASGTFTRDAGGDTLSHTRSVTIGGLTGSNTTRVVSGTGHWDSHGTFTGARNSRRYTQSATNTFASVVFPVGGGYPLSGSITHDVTGTLEVTGSRTESRSVSRHVVVTFNGTASVPMTVGSTSCTLRLDTRAVSCAR